jgi:hypothetical protein
MRLLHACAMRACTDLSACRYAVALVSWGTRTVLLGRTVGVLRTGVHVLLLVATRVQYEPFLYSTW